MAKTRKAKVKNGFLEGMEPPSHKDIDAAAENYFETMQERCALSKEEDEKKTALIEKMKEHDLLRYETPDGLVVTVTAKSNVKAKRKNVSDNDQTEE